MRDVVFISSPFQLVCFFEYTKHQNLKEYDLFIYFIGERDKEQFLNLCELYSINGYSLIKIRKAIQYLHFCKLADRYHKINKIIIGNFFTDTFLYLVNKIVYKELIVLDDGINSFEIPKHLKENSRISPQSDLKLFFHKLFRIDISYPINIKLFTIFDIKQSDQISIIKNNFTNIISKINTNQFDDSAYIIGQPFVELNFLSKEAYDLILYKALKSINKKHIYYIPSRKETKKNIQNIENRHDIKALIINYPLEVFFLMNPSPDLVIGFTSTALITLNKIINNLKSETIINSFKINKFANSSYQKRSSLMYNQIEENNITIIQP